MQSKPYKLNGKTFRYDFDHCMVAYITKADPEMLKDNEEWQEKYGCNLWDIDKDGYIELMSVGLARKNWTRKAVRNEYLNEWIVEIEEEAEALCRDFEKYELPLVKKGMEGR